MSFILTEIIAQSLTHMALHRVFLHNSLTQTLPTHLVTVVLAPTMADSAVCSVPSQVVRTPQSNWNPGSAAMAERDHMAPLSGVCSSPEWQASVTYLELNGIKCTALQGISCLSLFVWWTNGLVATFLDQNHRHGNRQVLRMVVFPKNLHLLQKGKIAY